MIFSDFFINFISLYTQYIHSDPIYIEYVRSTTYTTTQYSIAKPRHVLSIKNYYGSINIIQTFKFLILFKSFV
jgi:hypothetical protein